MTREDYLDRYGPVALVTGASSGIGLAIAEELAERGFHLVVTARRTARLDAMAERLATKFATRTTVIGADLADADAPAQILAETQGTDIGLVVSNAGFSFKGAFENSESAALAKLLTVNCHAPMQLAHGFLPRLKARALKSGGRGGLVFTASVEGLIGCPYSTAYAASKALVVALGEGLWGEAIGTGVDVLTLCPGATESEATAGIADLRGLQPAADVARLMLDNLENGPTFVPNDHYRAMFDQLRAGPRRETLTRMAQSMKALA